MTNLIDKYCPDCKSNKPQDEFYKNKSRGDGYASICKVCSKERNRAYYKSNREAVSKRHKEYSLTGEGKSVISKASDRYRKADLSVAATHECVARAIKSGKLVKPSECSRCCSDKSIEAHHIDYSKPLVVVWLCSMCHKEAHNG